MKSKLVAILSILSLALSSTDAGILPKIGIGHPGGECVSCGQDYDIVPCGGETYLEVTEQSCHRCALFRCVDHTSDKKDCVQCFESPNTLSDCPAGKLKLHPSTCSQCAFFACEE